MGENQTGEREFAGRHILVVEDEFLTSDDIALAFARLGVSTIGAYTLEEAMQLLESWPRSMARCSMSTCRGRWSFPLPTRCRSATIEIDICPGEPRDLADTQSKPVE